MDAWRQTVAETFLPLSVRPDRSDVFRWSLRNSHVGRVQLTRVTADPEAVARTPKLAAADDNNHYAVALQVQGRCVFRQDGREIEIRPGEFTIYDCTRPFGLRWPARHHLVVAMFNRNDFDLTADQVARITATRVSGRQGLGALVRPLLLRLSKDADSYAGVAGLRVASATLDMLSTLYGELLQTRRPNQRPTDVLAEQVKSYIEERLEDPELSVKNIAADHFISVRHLHSLFADEELTVSRWVRSRRLDAIRRDLANPLLAQRLVAAVAARHGLTNASYFSQLFRCEYGMSPIDYRAQELLRAQEQPGTDPAP